MARAPRKYTAYDKAYNAKPSQIAKRAAQVKLRREAEKAGRVKKGDGKDLHHVKPLHSGGPLLGKTKVISASKNRAMSKPKKRSK